MLRHSGPPSKDGSTSRLRQRGRDIEPDRKGFGPTATAGTARSLAPETSRTGQRRGLGSDAEPARREDRSFGFDRAPDLRKKAGSGQPDIGDGKRRRLRPAMRP